MTVRYVKALIYEIRHGPSVNYDNAPAATSSTERFDVRVEGGKATFEFKTKDLETSAQALDAVRPYIAAWELSAGLGLGPDAFRLDFKVVRFEEQNPTAGQKSIDAGPISWRFDIPGIKSVVRGLASYPKPPTELKVTHEIQAAFDQYMRHRRGLGDLPAMAYFCLTVLEDSVRAMPSVSQPRRRRLREEAARVYGLDRHDLNEVGRLSSEKGGAEARKVDGIKNDLDDKERLFLVGMTEKIIQRMAERQYALEQNSKSSEARPPADGNYST